MEDERKFIYHLLTANSLENAIRENLYYPKNFTEDGFIHCTEKMDTTLLVANDYFGNEQEVLVFRLNLSRIKPPVKFEPPSPVQGGGSSHLKEKNLFPHVYGELNLDSIEGVGVLKKNKGKFESPDSFLNLEKFLDNSK